MQIKVMIFGQLTDIIDSNVLTLTDIADTKSLLNELDSQYPALNQAKYIIAVDKQTVTENTIHCITETLYTENHAFYCTYIIYNI